MVNNLKNVDGKIKSVATKHKKSYPQSLYNLTDLQQDMYRRYKIGPKKKHRIHFKAYMRDIKS